MLSNVTRQLKENTVAVKQNDSELEKAEQAIQSLLSEIEDLEGRERALSLLVTEAMSALLSKRAIIAELRGKMRKASTGTGTNWMPNGRKCTSSS